MLREEVLREWSNLKAQLINILSFWQLFRENKELIKEALEIYIKQASSFLKQHFATNDDYARQTYLNKRTKNQQIVQTCQQLLAKLNEIK